MSSVASVLETRDELEASPLIKYFWKTSSGSKMKLGRWSEDRPGLSVEGGDCFGMFLCSGSDMCNMKCEP